MSSICLQYSLHPLDVFYRFYGGNTSLWQYDIVSLYGLFDIDNETPDRHTTRSKVDFNVYMTTSTIGLAISMVLLMPPFITKSIQQTIIYW